MLVLSDFYHWSDVVKITRISRIIEVDWQQLYLSSLGVSSITIVRPFSVNLYYGEEQ